MPGDDYTHSLLLAGFAWENGEMPSEEAIRRACQILGWTLDSPEDTTFALWLVVVPMETELQLREHGQIIHRIYSPPHGDLIVSMEWPE